MLISAPSLGFSITSPFRSITRGVARAGKGVVSVARDPNVQRAAVATAQQYAPQRYAQASRYASQARAILRPPGAPMPMGPMPDAAADDDGGDDPAAAPGLPLKPQHGISTMVALIAAGVIVFLIATKK